MNYHYWKADFQYACNVSLVKTWLYHKWKNCHIVPKVEVRSKILLWRKRPGKDCSEAYFSKLRFFKKARDTQASGISAQISYCETWIQTFSSSKNQMISTATEPQILDFGKITYHKPILKIVGQFKWIILLHFNLCQILAKIFMVFPCHLNITKFMISHWEVSDLIKKVDIIRRRSVMRITLSRRTVICQNGRQQKK